MTRQVQLIEDFGASTIMVTPSYALSILDEYRAQGRDPRESPLKVGIFGAEPWTNAMREEIEQAFDMHAVDIYGLSEVMGPASPMNASRPRTACTSGRITSTPRSSTPRPARFCPMARWANWSSPRSPRRPSRSSATAPAT
jgi:acyl-CoA synthetase (AMP-forming)/AMP-acid ligase II